jgi:hypothetical protein
MKQARRTPSDGPDSRDDRRGDDAASRKPARAADNPFVTFTEWSGEADEKAYGGL